VASQFRSTACEALLAKHPEKQTVGQRGVPPKNMGRLKKSEVTFVDREGLGNATQGARWQRKNVKFGKASGPNSIEMISSQGSVSSTNSVR